MECLLVRYTASQILMTPPIPNFDSWESQQATISMLDINSLYDDYSLNDMQNTFFRATVGSFLVYSVLNFVYN